MTVDVSPVRIIILFLLFMFIIYYFDCDPLDYMYQCLWKSMYIYVFVLYYVFNM